MNKTNRTNEAKAARASQQAHPYIGMWVTADGRIRQELLPGGRYDEARDGRPSVYTGSYKIRGNTIDYVDDTGFTADGEFREDVLYHGGMVFYREK
ncbi:Atu4866 domain-containing protein [Saccharibacillus sp. CPCC 101409]|uniref:Atu4866 domain-containing protein n=1 Tax=Saccharibacillus sp. CPCC 101409 TaxID=3058041 RepID=UPI002670E960|nr:Atu4866 domain-containing protein [Saccharibacillus sp. CPCC 101409]MDO3410321.1 Atu4866 domain-containing protein [Saccharibacillus sp. CPCC 101409]